MAMKKFSGIFSDVDVHFAKQNASDIGSADAEYRNSTSKTKMFAILVLAMVLLSGALSAAISVGAYTVTPTTLKPGEIGRAHV